MVLREEVELLWSLLPHPTPDHVVRLFARSGDQRFGDFARNPDEIMRFIKGSEGKNIYVGPNPTTCTTGVRHTSADVTHWSYLLLDMDPVCMCPPGSKIKLCRMCLGKAEPVEALHSALYWLGDWVNRDLETSNGNCIMIDSGRGAQAWIRLADIPLVDTITPGERTSLAITRKAARKSMGFWLKRLAEKLGDCYGCRLDTCTSDLPRVMRVPGTPNVKTGKLATFLTAALQIHDGLAEQLVSLTPERVFHEPDPGQFPPGTPWQLAVTKLTKKAQDYLLKGKQDPGRHETMWHTCQKLFEVGIERAETRKALQWANSLLGPDLELPPEQIETDLDQVYGRG